MDHIYNTPRAWMMGRYLTPESHRWDGPDAEFHPESDNIPWSLVPDRKVAVEDVAHLLSGHFQGTPYDPYSHQNTGRRGIYRSIGINRTGVTSICQIRPGRGLKGLEWICFGSTTFGGCCRCIPRWKMPAYLSAWTLDASTENWYWGSRLIAALADPNYGTCIQQIGRYREEMAARGRQIVAEYDRKQTNDERTLEEANAKLCEMARELTAETLGKVLADASEHMKNGFNLSDN